MWGLVHEMSGGFFANPVYFLPIWRLRGAVFFFFRLKTNHYRCSGDLLLCAHFFVVTAGSRECDPVRGVSIPYFVQGLVLAP